MLDEDSNVEAERLIQRVGARVRAARGAVKMSRRELSERSGVSPRYLAHLEGGKGNISIGLLAKVALALELSIVDLVSAEGAGTGGISELYAKADKDVQTQVMELLSPEAQRVERAGRICLIGLRGAGKSTLGAGLAEALGVPFVELNAEIEEKAGIPVGEIMALYGEEGYRKLEAENLEQIIATHEQVVLAVAGGIVTSEGAYARALARFHTVWIKAQPEEHMARVRAQGDLRPMAGNPEALTQLKQILTNREPLYRRAGFELDTSGKTRAASLKELRSLLATRGATA